MAAPAESMRDEGPRHSVRSVVQIPVRQHPIAILNGSEVATNGRMLFDNSVQGS
jgi:hypothetical protein